MSDLSELRKHNCKYIDTYEDFSIYSVKNTGLGNSHSDYVIVNNITGNIVDEDDNLPNIVKKVNDILINRLM